MKDKALAELTERYIGLIEALKEISQGAGRYDTDQLKHASNTIEDMKQLALEALKKFGNEQSR